MTVGLVAYAYLEPGDSAPECEFRSVSADIQRYLMEHIDDLGKRADQGRSAPAFFRPTTARRRFTDLQSGTKGAFLQAARDLTDRLHTAMDRRSKRGFFVLLRRSLSETDDQAAVLKLDVHDESAAIARRVNGDLRLEAVRDLLDLPGSLQKGAVYPDVRSESDVVVGDKVALETAQYFLRALEIQQMAAASSATKSFVDSVGAVSADKVEDIAVELDRYDRSISPREFLDEHPGLLSSGERRELLERLEKMPRPVRTLNPAVRPPRAVVSADGITIRGSVEDMGRVTWDPHDGGWRIQINVTDEPRKRYE